MVDFKCHHCNWILYRAEGDIDAEVICPKCRRINYPARNDSGYGLRGKDFQAKAVDHLCYRCQKLLLRSVGLGVIALHCYSCWKRGTKEQLVFDTIKMRNGTFKTPEIKEPFYIKMKENLAR